MPRSSETIRSLKKLARQRPSLRDSLFHIEYLPKTEDRIAAIICATQVEESLDDAIVEKLIPLTATERDELFTGEGPFSTFSSKIKVSYALGILGRKTRRDLDIIRWIRNAFAHSPKGIFFSTPEIESACALFTAPERIQNLKEHRAIDQPLNSARRRYIATASLISSALLMLRYPDLLEGFSREEMPLD